MPPPPPSPSTHNHTCHRRHCHGATPALRCTGTIFSLFKALFNDFSGHNIDMACVFLESAGRFLYKVRSMLALLG